MERKKKRKIVLEGFIRFKIKRRRFSCLRLHIYKQQSILIISAESDARALSRVFVEYFHFGMATFKDYALMIKYEKIEFNIRRCKTCH